MPPCRRRSARPGAVISPTTLVTAPTAYGIDWTSIGGIGDDLTAAAEHGRDVEHVRPGNVQGGRVLNQILRATVDTELLQGPDYRVIVGPGSGGSYPTPYWGNSGAQNAGSSSSAGRSSR